jgi:hypothetical protein
LRDFLLLTHLPHLFTLALGQFDVLVFHDLLEGLDQLVIIAKVIGQGFV